MDEIGILLARIAERDQPAFRTLYDRTAAKLFAVTLRILRERSDAEDAVQDCYAKIWRNAGQFRVSGHSAMTWLIAVARNTAIDRLRQRNPGAAPLADAEDVPDAAEGPEAKALAADTRRKLQDCLSQLEGRRAEALSRAYVEGFSYAELADRFGIPLNTMRTWLRRGLASLRECMSQ